jgi:hypothetical protein
MLSGPRTIHYSTELRLPSLPDTAISADRVAEVYNELRKLGNASRYINLHLEPGPPMIWTQRSNGRSACVFGPDFIRIEEDNPPDIDLDGFIEVVETVLKLFPQDVFITQRSLFRCTAQPHNAPDSLELLANRLAQVYEAIQPFERPPSFFGVRFRFGPQIIEDEEEENAEKPKQDPVIHRGYRTLRFETYSRDIKSVWMELAAQDLLERIAEGAESIKEIVANLRESHGFLTKKAKNFLDQFDTPNSEEGKNK